MAVQGQMMQDRLEKNKDLARRALDAVINQHRPEEITQFVSERFIDHSIFWRPKSIEEFVNAGKMFTAAFPDQHYEFQDVIAAGDKVVIRGIYSGTHKGNFAGIPPSGKEFSIVEIDIFRIEGDKIVEHWDAADTASMQRQLGITFPGRP
jgi:steroid delta-isomerase-like uncharacterized protein